MKFRLISRDDTYCWPNRNSTDRSATQNSKCCTWWSSSPSFWSNILVVYQFAHSLFHLSESRTLRIMNSTKDFYSQQRVRSLLQPVRDFIDESSSLSCKSIFERDSKSIIRPLAPDSQTATLQDILEMALQISREVEEGDDQPTSCSNRSSTVQPHSKPPRDWFLSRHYQFRLATHVARFFSELTNSEFDTFIN